MNDAQHPHEPIGAKTWAAFFLVFLLAFALKIIPLLTAVEHVSWNEELAVGTIGKELKEGARLSADLYQWDDYAGESLWLGSLASVYFRLFGDTLFALKAVPLTAGLLTWVLTFFFVYRYFGVRAALFTSLLRAVLPPLFSRYGLIVLGGHSEALLFNILVYMTFYIYVFDRHGQDRFALLVFGLFCGLGTWYHPLVFIAVLACLISWSMIRFRPFLKNAALWAAAFLAGFFPWILHNRFIYSQGWGFMASVFTATPENEGLRFLRRLAALLVRSTPSLFSFAFPDEMKHPLFMILYFLLFALLFTWACFVLLRGTAHHLVRVPRKKWPVLIYPFLFLALYALSNMHIPRDPLSGKIDFRYFTLFYYFACLLIGIALGGQKNPHPVLGAFALFLAFGLWGQSPMDFKEPFGGAFRFKGYSYVRYFYDWEEEPAVEQVCKAESTSQLIDLLEENRPLVSWPDRYFRLYGMWELCGNAYDSIVPNPATEDAGLRQTLERVKQKFPPDRYGWIYDKIGNAAAFRRSHQWTRAPLWVPEEMRQNFFNGFFRLPWSFYHNPQALRFLTLVQYLPADLQPLASWNIGKFMDPEDPAWQESELLGRLTEENKKAFYRGVGFASAPAHYGALAPELEGLLDFVPAAYRKDALLGLGWRIRKEYIEDRARGLSILKQFPSSWTAGLTEGFEACEKWFRIPAAPPEPGLFPSLKGT